MLEYAGGSAWGSCHPQPLVGYVAANALVEAAAASHIVCVPRAPLEAAEDPAVTDLPMGARLSGEARDANLVTPFGEVALADVRPIDDPEPDPVDVAERLIGAPYRAGGRTAAGIDAVGLVQLAFALCGVGTPRLLDLLDRFGEPVVTGTPVRRGDLVLFDGGAGLAIDDSRMIHASPSAGRVQVDPLPFSPTERRRSPR